MRAELPLMRTARLLEADSSFGVYHVSCDAPAGPLSEPEGTSGLTLVLPRAGRFTRHVDGVEYLVDTSTAYFEVPGQEQQIGHPSDGGDICTVVTCSNGLLEPTADPSEVAIAPVMPSSRVVFHHRALLAATDRSDHPAATDHVVGLITEAVRCIRPTELRGRPEAVRRRRQLVDAARQGLADDPSATLPELAAAVGCSPHHLSRIFPLVVGCSVSQYRMQMRIALALGRLEDGEDNLSVIAAEAGFADQAHLARVARRLLGETPSSLKRAIQQGPERA